MRNKATRQDGGLHRGRVATGDVKDGLSKTIAIAEDSGRNELMPGAYPDPSSFADLTANASTGSLTAATEGNNSSYSPFTVTIAGGDAAP